MQIKPPVVSRFQPGQILLLKGHGKVTCVYHGSKFCRVTNLEFPFNSRLARIGDLSAIEPPAPPPTRYKSREEELNAEFGFNA
jgi:hypothetical protein